MIDFYVTAWSKFSKQDMASQTYIIAWTEFNPVLHPEFFGNNGKYIYCVLEWSYFTMAGDSFKNLLRT